jgi:hypothetical protein
MTALLLATGVFPAYCPVQALPLCFRSSVWKDSSCPQLHSVVSLPIRNYLTTRQVGPQHIQPLPTIHRWPYRGTGFWRLWRPNLVSRARLNSTPKLPNVSVPSNSRTPPVNFQDSEDHISPTCADRAGRSGGLSIGASRSHLASTHKKLPPRRICKSSGWPRFFPRREVPAHR